MLSARLEAKTNSQCLNCEKLAEGEG